MRREGHHPADHKQQIPTGAPCHFVAPRLRRWHRKGHDALLFARWSMDWGVGVHEDDHRHRARRTVSLVYAERWRSRGAAFKREPCIENVELDTSAYSII